VGRTGKPEPVTARVQETSACAFLTEILPTLGQRQKAIYDNLVQHGPSTNLEVAYRLPRAINTITPRMNELVKLGVVHEVGRRPCRHSGRMAIVWQAVE
jgi:predicted transcriptional regulator